MNLSNYQTSTAAGEAVLQFALQQARTVFGERLIAAYALGSLAHGGFSEHVSDVDFAVVLADPFDADDAARIAALGEAVKSSGLPLADRLSLFWGSPQSLESGSDAGRFPPVDRLDLRENGRLMAGEDIRSRVMAPSTAEMVIAAARQALNSLAKPEWTAQLHDPAPLVAAGARTLTKRVLFPVRFLYTARTGAIGRNDSAVEHFVAVEPGPAAQLAQAAFLWRYDPYETGDARVMDRVRAGLLPLYRLFAMDYRRRLADLGEKDLALRFAAWSEALRR